MATTKPRYRIAHFDDISPVPCLCGMARRAFADADESPGTVHRTEITTEARPHYHRRLTETYFILDCGDGAQMELDGRLLPVRKGTCILIPPGVVHRAVGKMTVLIIVVPKFDPEDEVIVE